MDSVRLPDDGGGYPTVPPHVEGHKEEKTTPQKWVQCCSCYKWRKVPYYLKDSDLGDKWECPDNIWEPYYASCGMRQALSDDQIDAMLGSCPEVDDNGVITVEHHSAYPSPKYQIRTNQHDKRKGVLDGTELSDVAEALLRLGGDSGGPTASASGSKSLLSSLVPGRIIWGKVEGHDWWPCKVVRRRSVPSEVGPPPGRPEEVMYYTPVVFYTANGIPKEVEVSMECKEFPITICQRACGLMDEDEAEYAWLSADNIRLFCHGDVNGRKDGQPVEDELLRHCITAAQNDLAISEAQVQNWSNDEDSDGGWCCAADFTRNRHLRNKKANRRKLKRMDEGGSDMESGQDDGPELIPYGSFTLAPKITVEQIYAWRRPLSREERAKELEKENEEKALNLKKLAFLEEAILKQQPLSLSLFDGFDSHEHSSELQPALSMSLLDQSDLMQQEREAVSTLLAFGPLSEIDGESEMPSLEEAEYFVKYANRSHMHNEWGKETTLMAFAKRKLMQFKRRYCDEPINMFNKDWAKPERIISRRKCRTGPGWELLIKWCDLGYEYCTWESENARILSNAENVLLYLDLWKRQRNAVDKKSRKAMETYHQTKAQLFGSYKPLEGQPRWLRSGQLLQNQLDVLEWLRSMWIHDNGGVLSGDAGQGRTAATAAFLQCLKEEMKCIHPFLLVVPSVRMAKWDGEIDFWSQGRVYTVQYQGPPSARPMCLEFEIWQYMECMDDRNPCRDSRKIPKPDAVIVSSDVFPAELDNLLEIPWNVAIFDTRGVPKSSMQRLATAMARVKCPHFVIAGDLPSAEISLSHILKLVDPKHPLLIDVHEGNGDNDKDERMNEQLQTLLRNHVLKMGQPVRPLPNQSYTEIWIPLDFKPAQKEQYKESLVKYYDFLKDDGLHRFSAQNVGTLKHIAEELSLICFHPILADDNEDFDSIDKSEMINHSGKFEALAILLHELRDSNTNTLLLTQGHKTLSLLLKFVDDRFGQDSVECIFPSETTAKQHGTVRRFVSGDATFLLTTGDSCGLGMQLNKVSCVVIVESSLRADDDLIALSQMYQIGTTNDFPVFRFFLAGTVEERMLQTIRKSDAVTLSALARGNSYDMKIFEDVLVWGTQNLFVNEQELQRHPVLHTFPSRTVVCSLSEAMCKTLLAAVFSGTKQGVEGDYGDGIRWKRRTKQSLMQGADMTGLMMLHVTDPLLLAGYWEQLLRREWEEKRQLEDERAKRLALQQERYDLMEYEMEKDGSGTEGQEVLAKPPFKRKPVRKRFPLENETFAGAKGQKKQRSGINKSETGVLSHQEDRQNDENKWTKEALVSSKAHQDVLYQILLDPNTAEGKAAEEAAARIDRFSKELSLPMNINLMARQVADILLTMKEDHDSGLYFHDYTILVVIAFAAYLGRFDLGEQCGLKTLAAQYSQDLSVMEKLFNYVAKLMLEYKQMLIKINLLIRNNVHTQHHCSFSNVRCQQGQVAEGKTVASVSDTPQPVTQTAQSLHQELDTFLKNLSDTVQKAKEVKIEAEVQQLPAEILEQPPGAPIKGYQPKQRMFPPHLSTESPALAKKARRCEAEMFVIEKRHDTQFKMIGKHFQQFQERVRDYGLRALEQLDQETTTAKKQVEEVQQQVRQSVRALTQQQQLQKTTPQGNAIEMLLNEFQVQNQRQQAQEQHQQQQAVHLQQPSPARSTTDLLDRSMPTATRESGPLQFQTSHGNLDPTACVYNVGNSPRQPMTFDRLLLTITNSTNSPLPSVHKSPDISPAADRRSLPAKPPVPRVLQYTVPAHPFTMSKSARTSFHNVKLPPPNTFARQSSAEAGQIPAPFNLHPINIGQNPYPLYLSSSLPLHAVATQPLSIQLPNSPNVVNNMLSSGSAVCMIQPRIPTAPMPAMNTFSPQPSMGESMNMTGQYYATQWTASPSLRPKQQSTPVEVPIYNQPRSMAVQSHDGLYERVDSGQAKWSTLALASSPQMHPDLMPTVTTERPPARSPSLVVDVTGHEHSGNTRLEKSSSPPSGKATITTGVAKATILPLVGQDFATRQPVYATTSEAPALFTVQKVDQSPTPQTYIVKNSIEPSERPSTVQVDAVQNTQIDAVRVQSQPESRSVSTLVMTSDVTQAPATPDGIQPIVADPVEAPPPPLLPDPVSTAPDGVLGVYTEAAQVDSLQSVATLWSPRDRESSITVSRLEHTNSPPLSQAVNEAPSQQPSESAPKSS